MNKFKNLIKLNTKLKYTKYIIIYNNYDIKEIDNEFTVSLLNEIMYNEFTVSLLNEIMYNEFTVSLLNEIMNYSIII